MTLSLAAIFGAGFLTFLSPCVFPLVPVYIAALAGGNIQDIASHDRFRIFLRAMFFSAGFVLVFTLMGIGASGFGHILVSHKTSIQTISGLLILLFGLKFVGVIEVPWLDRVVRADDRRLGSKMNGFNAALMGVLFGAAWSPCIGPVLGSVLTYTASTTSSLAIGASYLAVYGVGMALPLLLIALFAQAGIRVIHRFRRAILVFERILGVLLLVVAGSLLFNFDLTPGVPGSDDSTPRSEPAASLATSATQQPAMLELYSKDCPVCREMKSVVESVTKLCSGKNVAFKSVDVSVQSNRHFIDTYKLVGIPTFVFLGSDGREVVRLVGKQSQEQLRQALSAVVEENCPGIGSLPVGKTGLADSKFSEATNCEQELSCIP